MASDLVIRFLGDTREFNAKLAETQAKLGEFSGKASATGRSLQSTLGLVAVGAVAAIGVASFELADKFDVVRERLETVTKAVGENFEDFKDKVGETDKKMATLGFSAIDTEGSLAKLTAATHDVGKATDLMTVAADLARFKNTDLATATDTLVKVEAGRFRGLQALGIQTGDLKGKTDAVQIATQRLTDLVKGQASAYTDTWAGKLDVLKATLQNVGIAIGEKIEPVLDALFKGITTGIGAFQRFNTETEGWAGKLAAVAVTAPLAIAGIAKLVSLAAAGAGAIKAFAENVYLWSILNPGLATGLGLAAAAAVGFIAIMHSFGQTQEEVKHKTEDLVQAVQSEHVELGIASAQTLNAWVAAHERAVDVLNETNLSITDVVDAVQGSDDEYRRTTHTLEEFFRTHQGLGGTMDAEAAAANSLKNQIEEGRQAFERSRDQLNQNTKQTKELGGAQLDTTKATKTLAEKAQDEADAQKAAKQAVKDHQKALDDLTKAAGPAAARLAQATHQTTDAIKAEADEVKQLDDAFQTSFENANDILDKFKDKSKVDFQAFVDEQFKTIIATQNWSTNIAQLAKDGIDRGFLDSLIKAGPATAGLVQSILDNVKKGSIGTVNSLERAAREGEARTRNTLNNYRTGVAQFTQFVNSQRPHLDVAVTANGKPIITNQYGQPVAGSGLVVPGGARRSARGNHLAAGEPSIVGEFGEEWFVPDTAGTVVPHGKTPTKAFAVGGGGDVYLAVNVNGAVLANANDIANAVIPALEMNRFELVRRLRLEGVG